MTSGTLRAELVFRTNSALALRRRGDHRWYITPDELRFLRLCRTAKRSTKWLMAQCAEGKVARAEKCGRRRKSYGGLEGSDGDHRIKGEPDLRAEPREAGCKRVMAIGTKIERLGRGHRNEPHTAQCAN